MDDPTTDVPGALRAQRTQIAERIDRLQQLSAGLDRMIDAHERGLLLTIEQQAAIFGPRWNPEWFAQARELYGDTTQWQQYAERSASRGPEEWQAVADDVAGFDQALGEAMDAGVTPGSPEANQLVERHREVFASYFPLTRQMQVCLGRMYEADPGFAAHYDGIRAGLAAWFRRLIDASARAHSIDPTPRPGSSARARKPAPVGRVSRLEFPVRASQHASLHTCCERPDGACPVICRTRGWPTVIRDTEMIDRAVQRCAPVPVIRAPRAERGRTHRGGRRATAPSGPARKAQ